MTRLRSSLLCVLLLSLMVTAPVSALDPAGGADDAGSGRDAPDRPPSGLLLVTGAIYTGGFGVEDHWDWYAVEPSTAKVLHVEVHAPELCVVARWDGTVVTRGCASPLRPASLWLPGRSGGVWELGLEGSIVGSYTIALGGDAFAPRPGPGVGGAWEDDAEIGRDAPDIPADLVRLPEGTYRGQGAMHLGDMQDWYRLSVPSGSKVRVTLTSGSSSCLELVPRSLADPAAPCVLRPDEPVQTVEATLTEDVWYLRVGSLLNPYHLRVEGVP